MWPKLQPPSSGEVTAQREQAAASQPKDTHLCMADTQGPANLLRCPTPSAQKVAGPWSSVDNSGIPAGPVWGEAGQLLHLPCPFPKLQSQVTVQT